MCRKEWPAVREEMHMERRIKRRYRKVSRAPIFLLAAMMLLLIGAVALLFGMFVVEDMDRDPNEQKLAFLNAPTELFPGQVFPGDLAEAAALKRFEEQAGISPVPDYSELETQFVTVDTLVPETVPVEESYFEDAIFIGDSISQGLKTNIRQISSTLSPNQFIAEKNISLLSVIGDQPVFDSKTKTLWQAMEAQMPDPGKIYILLGTNGLPWYENEEQIEMYGTLIDEMKERYPDAILYVESLTPKRQVSDYDSKFDSAKINDFNDRLFQLAEEKGVYYLDVQTTLKDDNGYLKEEYSTSEGLHPIAAGHKAMLDYYKNHAVQSDGTAEVVVS